MIDKPHIIILIGASSSGKDTIKRYLLNDKKYTSMIPITTRPIRSYEKENIDYNFISRAKFEELIETNQLLEHRKYNVINFDGKEDVWYYGHTQPTGKINIMVATIDTYTSIKDNNNFIIHPFYIYLKPIERLNRMINRESKMDNPNYQELARRFFADENDFSEKRLEDAGLTFENKCVKIENIDSKITADFIDDFINNELNLKDDINEI